MGAGRYLVFAFYDNLGMKFRTTDYDRKDDAFEYIGGLRLCDTPYIAFDMKEGRKFHWMETKNYPLERMIKIMKEEWGTDDKKSI